MDTERDLEKSLDYIANQIREYGHDLDTEEATKTALIMPFINEVLGYNTRNAKEVKPEYTADVGSKKNEKVDFAILAENKLSVLVECKKFGENLVNHKNQLIRYFNVTLARIAILTDGRHYEFYTDIDKPNVMDDKPFLKLDILNRTSIDLVELRKLTKEEFNIDTIISSASDLKYKTQIIEIIEEQLGKPDRDFVKFFTSRVCKSSMTQKIYDQFSEIVANAFQHYLDEEIERRLRKALQKVDKPEPDDNKQPANENNDAVMLDDAAKGIVTTPEEIEAYNIVRAIACEMITVNRVIMRDAKSYCAILIDNNNRQPLCRFYFDRKVKKIGFFNADKEETQHSIVALEEIYQFKKEICDTARRYLALAE